MSCTTPKVIDEQGTKVPCGTCNKCVGRRVSQWVARAMAEKSMAKFTYAITLTFNDVGADNQRYARIFDYTPVEAFFDRVRALARRKWRQSIDFKFLAAGERGSKGTERVHWHCVVFSDRDILELGQWKAAWGPITEREKKITVGRREKRCDWSVWGHGYVVVQEPDEGGMRYALLYALKDQFSFRSSKGKRRERTSEVFASGMFRMSKHPPVGYRPLARFCREMYDRMIVPPTLGVPVEGLSFEWIPDGRLREAQVATYVAINTLYRKKNGRDAPGWRSLLHWSKQRTKVLEGLGYVYEEGQIAPLEKAGGVFEDASYQREFQIRQANLANRALGAHVIGRCFGPLPCWDCASALSEEGLEKAGLVWEWAQEGEPRLGCPGQYSGRNEHGGHECCAYAEHPNYKSWAAIAAKPKRNVF